MPKGSTLVRLRKELLGDRNRNDLSPLSDMFIFELIRFYRMRHGRLPTPQCGPAEGVPGETWLNWDFALMYAYPGMPGGSSLAKLKEEALQGAEMSHSHGAQARQTGPADSDFR